MPSTTPAFQLKNLDRKLKYKACKEHKSVKGWKCACGLNWHTCDVHRVYRNTSNPQDTMCGTPAPGRPDDHPARAANKRKASCIEDDYDALLAEDEKRAKQVQSIQRGVKRAGDISLGGSTPAARLPKLWPILSHRFRGCSSASSRD